jgi:phytoene synthase
MSDTSNPANLASAEDFDARLKRTDEARWLATRYAPQASRERLVAVYLLHQELQRTLQTKEPMLGKIRLQWWRETLEQVAGKAPVRRHDLAEELARVTKDRQDLIAPMNDLIDRFDDNIDDHMHGGHTAGGDHEARHLATEGALARLAGRALDPAASPGHLDALANASEARIAVMAELTGGSLKWNAARIAARKIPAPLWPAILHLAVTDSADHDRSPLGSRWRMFRAALTRRL